MVLWHGGRSVERHSGLCLTDCERTAAAYAERSCSDADSVHTVEIDMDSLVVEHVDAYDRDADSAPADSAKDRARYLAAGVDVVVFADEDPRGRGHLTYRLISERALAAVAV